MMATFCLTETAVCRVTLDITIYDSYGSIRDFANVPSMVSGGACFLFFFPMEHFCLAVTLSSPSQPPC